jgi:hypothetical protein
VYGAALGGVGLPRRLGRAGRRRRTRTLAGDRCRCRSSRRARDRPGGDRRPAAGREAGGYRSGAVSLRKSSSVRATSSGSRSVR